MAIEGTHVLQHQARRGVPPGAASFPSKAFGFGAARYIAFLEALLDGLRAYEAVRTGGGHAPTPLPAA